MAHKMVRFSDAETKFIMQKYEERRSQFPNETKLHPAVYQDIATDVNLTFRGGEEIVGWEQIQTKIQTIHRSLKRVNKPTTSHLSTLHTVLTSTNHAAEKIGRRNIKQLLVGLAQAIEELCTDYEGLRKELIALRDIRAAIEKFNMERDE
jgi:hypothetical protein